MQLIANTGLKRDQAANEDFHELSSVSSDSNDSKVSNVSNVRFEVYTLNFELWIRNCQSKFNSLEFRLNFQVKMVQFWKFSPSSGSILGQTQARSWINFDYFDRGYKLIATDWLETKPNQTKPNQT